MGKATRVIRCHRCGNVLQTKSKSEIGFVSKAVLEAGTKIPYCNNCYESMMELNNSVLKQDVEKDILKILKDAVAVDATIVWIVDLFTFNGTLDEEIVKKVKKLSCVVVGTKYDLFPKDKQKDLLEFLKVTFNEAGINPVGITLTKNIPEVDFNELARELDAIRQGHDVYVIGNLLSGKQTLISRYLKVYENKTQRSVCQITYPGTEKKVLEIPLSNSSFMYELPDLPNNTSILNKVDKELFQYIVPKKQIKYDLRRLLVGDSFIVGNLMSVSLLKGPITSFYFYSGEGVETKKVKTTALADIMRDNYHKKTIRPVSEKIISFLDYDIFDYEMEDDGLAHDIGVEGLGWVKFIAKGQTIRIAAPKGTAIKETLSKVK